jgi:hypothetical protein
MKLLAFWLAVAAAASIAIITDGTPNFVKNQCDGFTLEIIPFPLSTPPMFLFARQYPPTANYCLQVSWDASVTQTIQGK